MMTNHNNAPLKLVLASSSPYRRQLLDKLGLRFEAISPDIDESALQNETPDELVQRLALEKARSVAKTQQDALIIGSDQVAVLDDEVITRPHDHETARLQLRQSSGRSVTFLTGLCLYNSCRHQHQVTVEPFTVEFLSLSDEQIEHYLNKEKPYNCAGSFRAEGLGITLFSKLEGGDPNSLIGLPLIQLTAMLRREGCDPLLSPDGATHDFNRK